MPAAPQTDNHTKSRSIRQSHAAAGPWNLLSAAVVNLAVKGFLEIDVDGGDYTLRRKRNDLDDSLAPGEAVLMSKLFSKGSSIRLEDDNHAVIGAARTAWMMKTVRLA